MDFLPDHFSLFDVLNYADTVNFVLGASKSGKTSFLRKLVCSQNSSQKVYLLDTSSSNVTNSLADIDGVVTLNAEFRLTENCLKTLPPHSILIIDDFQLHSKIDEWQRVINFCAHHFNLSIFLVVHSHIFTNGLHFALNNCRNLYLTYSNNSKSFLRSLCGGRFSHFFNCNWKEGLAGFHVSFINTYHSFMINFVDRLLLKGFASGPLVEVLDMSDYDISDIASIQEKRFYISDRPIQQLKNENEDKNRDKGGLEAFFSEELSKVFKSKGSFPKMFKIVRCLLSKDVLSYDELILGKVNLFDFLSFTQKFTISSSKKQKQTTCSSDEHELENHLSREPATLGYLYVKKSAQSKKQKKHKKHKKESDKKMIKLCKKLKKKGVIIPISLIKNPKVRKIFS